MALTCGWIGFSMADVDCDCACSAYVHHLLEAREMLATMLLEYHNVHHMQCFVAAIRDSLHKGTFVSMLEHFEVELRAAGS
jgi:tRNA-guanine family transglycosylase